MADKNLTAEELYNAIDSVLFDHFDDEAEDTKAVAYFNGKCYPVLSVEPDTDEGWVVINLGSQEVQREG